jgi:flagellar hook assembly protein FlgD
MATELRLGVHDLGGRLVKTLWNGSVAAGTHSIEWDGNDDDGLRVNSGIYFVRARSGEFQKVERVLRVR